MDYLIIIAIVAIALLLTGLTNVDALRRPFRPKAKRASRSDGSADRPARSHDPDSASQASRPHTDGQQSP